MSTQPEVSVGQGHPRVDGRLKVTGRARYAADHGSADGIDDIAHAVMIDATIGAGTIRSIDTTRAEAVPGVIGIITHRNAPRLPYRDNTGGSNNPPGERLHVLQDDRVNFFGQPVAVVVARQLETAQHAVRLVEVTYDAQRTSTQLRTGSADEPTTYGRGDTAEALTRSQVQVDATHTLARNHHNPMEPHATIARWEGGRLTVWDKTQWVRGGTQQELAAVFGLSPDDVRVISPFVGGGFGTGLRAWPHTTVAAIAAREVGQPVKLVMTRRQLYFGTGFRPAYDYRLRLGADRQGRLLAAVHDLRGETSRYETFTEAVTSPGQMMYSTANVAQRYSTVPLDVSTPIYMRGPGYATGAHVLETAMDELAHELDIDPIELRRRNEPGADEASGLPFSSRRLLNCYSVGAREFGWQDRRLRPGAVRDGDWLVGTGMAAAVYDAGRMEAQASVRLNIDGTALVQAAASDMGPGTYTSLTQVAADELGLPFAAVTVRLGDSTMPATPPHGGSMTMASVGSAVFDGARRARLGAIDLAVRDVRSPLHGVDPADVVVAGGVLAERRRPGRTESYRVLLARNGRAHLDVTGHFTPPEQVTRSLFGFGAVFAEVGVDADLGLIRVRRMLGVYDAGKIVNPRLADSQALGGMVGGIGKALLEETVTDHRDGRIVNSNMADYLVPVNADIGELRAIFVPGRDDFVAPDLGVKGLAELVMVGIAPAISNAIFNATGRRVRDLPITLDKLM